MTKICIYDTIKVFAQNNVDILSQVKLIIPFVYMYPACLANKTQSNISSAKARKFTDACTYSVTCASLIK